MGGSAVQTIFTASMAPTGAGSARLSAVSPEETSGYFTDFYSQTLPVVGDGTIAIEAAPCGVVKISNDGAAGTPFDNGIATTQCIPLVVGANTTNIAVVSIRGKTGSFSGGGFGQSFFGFCDVHGDADSATSPMGVFRILNQNRTPILNTSITAEVGGETLALISAPDGWSHTAFHTYTITASLVQESTNAVDNPTLYDVAFTFYIDGIKVNRRVQPVYSDGAGYTGYEGTSMSVAAGNREYNSFSSGIPDTYVDCISLGSIRA